jgi:hypothetical protein
VSPAAPEKLFDLLAFLGGEADDVLLVHGETPVGLIPTRIHAYLLVLNQSVTEY